MPKVNRKPVYLAALDLGSTKVVFSIASAKPDGIEVIGVGSVPHTGVKQGIVVNIDSTTEAILKAKEEAELMSGVKVDNVWLGVGGTHIESFQSNGMVAVSGKEVLDTDIDRVIEAAKAVAIPSDRTVLHVIPNFYKLDSQSGISDPLGMSGVRLESSVHIVTALKSALQNSIKATEKAGLTVNGTVLQSLASSMSVLTEDEKKLGVTLVTLGGGKCELISFVAGSAIHTSIIPVGGQHFTGDIAMGLRTTQDNAETLKCKYAHAIAETVTGSENIEVESVGGRPPRTIDRKTLCQIVEARAEETLALIMSELNSANLINHLGSGIVLTGGASQLKGLLELGDYQLDLPVRLGLPKTVGGLTDVVKTAGYSTTVGLLIYARKQIKQVIIEASSEKEAEQRYEIKSLSKATKKMKNFFENLIN